MCTWSGRLPPIRSSRCWSESDIVRNHAPPASSPTVHFSLSTLKALPASSTRDAVFPQQLANAIQRDCFHRVTVRGDGRGAKERVVDGFLGGLDDRLEQGAGRVVRQLL